MMANMTNDKNLSTVLANSSNHMNVVPRSTMNTNGETEN